MPKRSHDIPEEYAEYERELAHAIGARIRQRRLQLKLNQADVRAKMELQAVLITRARFSRIENGEYLPNAAVIIALCATLHVSCRWLLFGDVETSSG